MAGVVRDISALTPLAQMACELFMAECKKQVLKVRITETYRSQERQNELYAQGRTKAGNKVTWTLNSRHTSRRAWDICQDIKGKEYDTSTGFFEKCGAVAKKFGITWGGTWKTPDRPHFEIPTNWQPPKESDEMTEQERNILNTLQKDVQRLNEEHAVYDYIDQNMPKWMQEITIWAMSKNIIHGTGAGLGMTKAKAETLVMIKNLLEGLQNDV